MPKNDLSFELKTIPIKAGKIKLITIIKDNLNNSIITSYLLKSIILNITHTDIFDYIYAIKFGKDMIQYTLNNCV